MTTEKQFIIKTIYLVFLVMKNMLSHAFFLKDLLLISLLLLPTFTPNFLQINKIIHTRQQNFFFKKSFNFNQKFLQ
jgi:hypothetical protein